MTLDRPSILLAGALALATGTVAAQVTSPNTLAQPARPATGTGVGVTTPPAARPAPISATPAQRPGAASPIQSVGPSKTAPVSAPMRPVTPVAPSAAAPVRDAQGRTVPGAMRVAPGRAIDPATGRSFQTIAPPAAPTR